MRHENFELGGDGLEEQFTYREKLNLKGEDFELVDIRPEQLKTETPVVLGVGWGGEPDAYKEVILSLARTGRRVLSIDAIHGTGHDIKSEESRGFPEIELRKVAAFIESLNAKDLDKVDAVAYSEGGIYVTLAAILYPEKFRNLVLVNPGGMVGKDNELRLTAGFLKDFVRHFVESVGDKKNLNRWAKAYGGMAKSAAKDLPKAVREISAISGTQIQGYLENLKEQGIGISVIHGVSDSAFPMDRIQRETNSDQVDGFYSVKGAHIDFLIQAEKYVHVVDEALDALESKKNRA